MGAPDFYSPDYIAARGRFLEAARDAGAAIDSHPFEGEGPGGEPLAMDVARLGPARADRVVLASSGLHGVEGFFGSAIQLAWLRSRGSGWAPPPGTALLLVHALNPYGFAWRRRWNENNVDLNRNFLDDRSFLEDDPKYREGRDAYDRLAAFLNPASPPSRWEPYPLKAAGRILSAGLAARRRESGRGGSAPSPMALGAIWGLGMLELRKTLPVGQYEHPRGLFYGGAGPERTVRVVRESLPDWAGGAGEVVHVDFHSGLGRWAEYRLLLVDEAGSEGEWWASGRFGAGAVEPWDGRTAYAARGLMGADIRDRLAGARCRFVTAEVGTYPGAKVLGALRAENRAHFHDRPGTASYRWAKQRIMEVFCPASARWREAAVRDGLAILDRAIAPEPRTPTDPSSDHGLQSHR